MHLRSQNGCGRRAIKSPISLFGDTGEANVTDDLLLQQQADEADRTIQKYKRERDGWKSAHSALLKAQEELEARLRVAEYLESHTVIAPPWARQKRGKKQQATALHMLSDLHFDEVVKPNQVLDTNAYNRQIAEMRLKKDVEHTCSMAFDLLGGFRYDGMVLLLGGDIFSGLIHEELRETNEAPALASLEYWVEPLCSAIKTFADEFKKVLIVGVVGNHGRLTPKMPYKGAVENNLDWSLYCQLARHFRDIGDQRISWNVPVALDAYFEIYGYRHVLTHGNQARGGSGISGLLTPLSLLDHRKRKRDASTLGTATHMWMGHFHQYLNGPGWTVNGSMKGYDEFAFGNNFGYEDPQQAFAVITPEHNVTIQTAVYCMDRKQEKW